jgi:hypothetical protein
MKPGRCLVHLLLVLATVAGCAEVAQDQRGSSYTASIPTHPAVTMNGVVDSFDPTTGVLTFRDGRMIQLTSESTITLPAEAPRRLEPGQTVVVEHARPVGVRTAAGSPAPASDQVTGYQRMGTVAAIDANAVRLTDGEVMRMSPNAKVHLGVDGPALVLADVRPGDEVVIVVSDPSTADITEVMVFRPVAGR